MIAVVLGIAGAAITNAANHKSTAGDSSYYWFDPSGDYTGDNTTVSQEQTSTGCNNTTNTLCENGYTGDQFNTPGDPNSGLVSGATPAQVIKQKQ